MLDLIKEISQTFKSNKLRTFLTGFSVAWGIFMLILLLSIAQGVVNDSMEWAKSSDPNRISVWGGITTLPYAGLKEGRSIDLKKRDMEALKEASRKNISNVTAEISLQGQISTGRDYLTSSSAKGVFPQYFNGNYTILHGRAINEADIHGLRKVIMLHHDDAVKLFSDPENAIGKIVKVGNTVFTLVGVYDLKWDNTPFIPFTTAYALSGYRDDFNNLNVHLMGVTDEKQSAEIEQLVKETLAKTEQFNPNDQSAIWTFDRFASSIQQQNGLKILTYTMWVIGILTLITGIVGVSNIMFVSVKERTHEIGIRRAIGAKPASVLGQIVLESVALTTLFGYIGIVMGTLATEIVKKAFANQDFPLHPVVDLSIAYKVTIALILAGAMAGLFPAIKATKVKPVEALRDE